MHRGRVILGAVVGGALAVAAFTQVASWSPDATGWDGYGPTGPTIEPTIEPLPADRTTPPECMDEYQAALREAQQSSATIFAYACALNPVEDCVPEHILVEEPGRPPEYVQQTCE
jgi:hypothetical protein